MQRHVMDSLPAPRQADKKDTQVHVVPYRAPEVEGESEEPTEFGLVWEFYVSKETEEAQMDPLGGDMARQMNEPHTDGIVCNGEQWMVAARNERRESASANLRNASSQVPSPSLSDFEAYLGDLESDRGRETPL